jgi:NADH-quinone oxidoreductase subunit J
MSLAVLYLTLQAPFLFAVQIIVYTGAILMLFLFVLMLVGVDASDSVVETIKGQRFMAILGGLLLGAVLVIGLAQMSLGAVVGLDIANANGNVPALADIMFSQYVFAFEVTSALLITAAVGAMVLAHIEREPGSRRTQKELSRARFLTSDHPQTLPGPGVFARANSVAVPAILPDGTRSEASLATGIEPEEPDQMRRPTGREELGSRDAALGTLDPAPLDGNDR